ncbi:hypothetical protein CLU79DRAFT_837821 [Phycomyces nitens]|nr:hypothetical protein CLU79DRAFT_837821 [Phycomyces nitens]
MDYEYDDLHTNDEDEDDIEILLDPSDLDLQDQFIFEIFFCPSKPCRSLPTHLIIYFFHLTFFSHLSRHTLLSHVSPQFFQMTNV